ncbi:hypothetical protein [Phormidesmis priestleyi]|uniref:hypothetical protein n=1 Tax=Phormidesmis priestleyi TaxID=268141 RepID=UPI00083B3794|nr:hypothetical protein [Phormidesmis priestleyi]
MHSPSESDLTPNSSTQGFDYFKEQSAPSTRIDAVICDLMAHIENYSDEDFDSQWMHLTSAEVEAMVVALIRHLMDTMNGKLLSGYLLGSRQEESSAPEDEIE